MFILRDMKAQLEEFSTLIQILIGPRQCGKSTLFDSLGNANTHFKKVSFDDGQMQQLAQRDPALFLEQFDGPLLLDEVQYVPNLFPELKRRIDQLKLNRTFGRIPSFPEKVLYRLTGSNQVLMDRNVKESLVGRASYYYLNTLTVHEIRTTFPDMTIKEIMFKGGWPELYVNNSVKTVDYLNDYLRTYVEKEIVLSAGIQKILEFQTVLGLLAARSAQLLDYSNIARDSGVQSVTVKEWVSLLDRSDIVYLLRPYFSNLNNRLVKSPKLYFLDTGLAVRLQAWQEIQPLMTSPQAGHLFETLVLAEIIKFIRNYRKDWQLFFWRTRDGEEIDFVLKTNRDEVHAFEVKLAIQNIPVSLEYPASFKKHFSPTKPLAIIHYGEGEIQKNSKNLTIPISKLHGYLMTL